METKAFYHKKVAKRKKIKVCTYYIGNHIYENIIGIGKRIYMDIYFYGTNFIFIFKFMLRTGPFF